MRQTTLGPGGADPFVLPLHTVGTRHGQTGEQRLLLALLSDAMQAYSAELARRRRPHRIRELRRWFESTDRSYVFAFESVCDALGLDAAYVRRRVLGVPGVKEAEVELVFDPPWDPSRRSDAAKLQLGFM